MSVDLHGPGLWYVTRATGLVALLLLTASVLLGLLNAGRFRGHLHTPFLVPPLPDAACRFWYSQRNSYPQTVAAGRTVTPGRRAPSPGFPNGRHHRRLDGVQPVLRLVEHDGGG